MRAPCVVLDVCCADLFLWALFVFKSCELISTETVEMVLHALAPPRPRPAEVTLWPFDCEAFIVSCEFLLEMAVGVAAELVNACLTPP